MRAPILKCVDYSSLKNRLIKCISEKMTGQKKNELLFRALKIYGRLNSTWPPDMGAKIKNIIMYEFFWWITFLNVIGLLIPLFLGVYHFRNDIQILGQAASELTALMEVFFNMIICKLQKSRLKMILQKIQNFQRDADDVEKNVMEKYAKRYFNFQLCVGSSFLLTAVAFSCFPIVTTRVFPADAWYPFSVKPLWTKILIYTSQVFAIIQTALSVGVDLMVAALFWYSSVRLELLQNELRNISTEEDLVKCIRKHHELIAFFGEISEAVRFLIIKSTFTMAITIVFSGIQFLGHSPLDVISKFVLMTIGASLRLFLTSWAAQDLKEQSEKIAESIYESSWINKSVKIRKSLTIMIFRSRKPFVISAPGIMSEFSLEYYASFLATTLNYFMMLRAIIN